MGSFAVSSDYASLRTNNGWEFYYGYEHVMAPDGRDYRFHEIPPAAREDEDREWEWCFRATKGEWKRVIPFSKLGPVPDDGRFNCAGCLVFGIAQLLGDGTLVLSEEAKTDE